MAYNHKFEEAGNWEVRTVSNGRGKPKTFERFVQREVHNVYGTLDEFIESIKKAAEGLKDARFDYALHDDYYGDELRYLSVYGWVELDANEKAAYDGYKEAERSKAAALAEAQRKAEEREFERLLKSRPDLATKLKEEQDGD